MLLLRLLRFSNPPTPSFLLHRYCRPSLWSKLPRSGRRGGCDIHAQLFSRLSMLYSKPRASSSLCTNFDENKSSSQRPTYVTFLTDVEGDGEYLDRFVTHSKLLGFQTVTPSFGRYGKRQYGEHENKFDGETWNLGRYDEDYFPYDKEIVFLDDDGDSGDHNSMLVYGVSQLQFVSTRCSVCHSFLLSIVSYPIIQGGYLGQGRVGPLHAAATSIFSSPISTPCPFFDGQQGY
jgi:hypothetical protein